MKYYDEDILYINFVSAVNIAVNKFFGSLGFFVITDFLYYYLIFSQKNS